MFLWFAAGAAHAREPMPGLLEDEPVYKWSAPTLDGGEWIAGVQVVAHGLSDDLTLSTDASSLVLGFYNARARLALPEIFGGRASIEAGAGLLTPVALARLAVPGWRSRPALAIFDVSGAVTLQPAPGRLVTVRPWLSIGVGRLTGDDAGTVALLGRTAVSGGGLRGTLEVHFARRVGFVVGEDLGLDGHGGYGRLVSRTTGALLFGTGKLRANVGLGLVVALPVSDRGAPVLRPVPAFDVWGRW